MAVKSRFITYNFLGLRREYESLVFESRATQDTCMENFASIAGKQDEFEQRI